MERAIGEIFKFEGIKLKVVEGKGCDGCYFQDKACCEPIRRERGKCTIYIRNDKKSIIFKLLEE